MILRNQNSLISYREGGLNDLRNTLQTEKLKNDRFVISSLVGKKKKKNWQRDIYNRG